MDNTEEQPMPSLNPRSQSSYPILKQFEEYCNEPHQPVEQWFPTRVPFASSRGAADLPLYVLTDLVTFDI